jgi:cytochrome c553
MHDFLAFVVAALTVMASEPASAQAAPAVAAPCGACHGLNGNSPTPQWPSLAGQHPRYTVAQLKAYQAGDRKDPNMNALVTTLSEQDIVAIAAFYASQQPDIKSISVDQVAAGESLYRGGNAASGVPACMACHGPNGAGNALAGYPALRGQHIDYTVKQLKDYRDGARTTDLNQMMRTIAQRLTIAEIEAVATYVSALH